MPESSAISIMDLFYPSPPSAPSSSSSLSPTTLTATSTPPPTPPSPSTSISSLSPLYYPSSFSSPAFPSLINRRLIIKSPESADTLYTLQAVLVTFYLLIFLSAISGNCLVILTLVQNKRLRTVTNVFLFNLAVSDLLLAVFCMPFTLVPFLLRNFIFGTAMCVMIRYLQGVSVSVSCFTLVAMSLERYFAICHPLYSRQWQTLSHAYKTIAACWLLAFAVVIPIAIYTKLVSTWNGQIHFCREIWPTKLGSQSYTVFLDWILLIVPILIMSCSYGLIVRTLWLGIKMDEKIQKDAEKSKKKEKENVKMIVCNETTKINQGGDLKKHAKKYTENNPRHDGADRKQISKRNPKRKCNQSVTPNHNSNLNLSSSSQHRKHRRLTGGGGVRQSNMGKSVTTKKRVIKMLCVIVLEFFVCWCPLFCVQTWKAFDPRGIRRHLTAVGMNSIYLLAYLSSCCNPITYCFMNKSFRKAFLATFHCVTKRLPGGKDQQRHRHQQLQLLQLEMQDQQQQQQQQQQQEKDQQLQQKQKEQEYEEQQQQQQQQQQHRHLLQQHCHLEKQHDLESEVSTETTKFEPENTSTEADTVETFDNDDDDDDDDAVNTFSSDSESFSKQSD